MLFLVGFPSSPSLSFPEPLLSWPGIVPVLAHLLMSLVLWSVQAVAALRDLYFTSTHSLWFLSFNIWGISKDV